MWQLVEGRSDRLESEFVVPGVQCVFIQCLIQHLSTMSHALIPMNGEVHEDQENLFASHIQLSSSTLGIIYSLVARGGVILAHHACCHGNFTEVAQQVLRSVVRETDCRLSYAAGE